MSNNQYLAAMAACILGLLVLAHCDLGDRWEGLPSSRETPEVFK